MGILFRSHFCCAQKLHQNTFANKMVMMLMIRFAVSFTLSSYLMHQPRYTQTIDYSYR